MKKLKSLIPMIGIFAILLTVTACDLNPASDPTTSSDPTTPSTPSTPSDPSTPSGVNLAKGCTVTVSTAQSDQPKENLVDDDLQTQWSSKGFSPADFTVDLRGVKQISTIKLYPSYDLEGASEGKISYTLECCDDGKTWVKVKDSPEYTVGDPSKCDPLILDGLSVSCRYLRVSTTQWPGWVAAYEFEVYK